MSEPKKNKNTVIVSYIFPLHKSECGLGQFTLDEIKRWASPTPLRQPAPRKQPERPTDPKRKDDEQPK